MSVSIETEINSWRDADRILARLARIHERLGLLRERADERIEIIEQRLGEESSGLLSEAGVLRQEIERFFRCKDDENPEGIRSRTLPSGRIGLRFTDHLEINRPEVTMRRLAERGLGDCIRLRQEIDRQALRRLDDATLRSLGVKRLRREVFYAVPRKKG
ncbi:host-nuclease inhibitor Gam family protein [candidate division WOR-3 bacterium]|nr:host-nuclease inhibitor Gam family protein [candidate division WOR-3 bacterium]